MTTQNSKLKTQNSKLFSLVPTEDFWSRRANAQTVAFDFAPFGSPTHITANEPAVLAAARLSAGRFSRATQPDGRAMRIQVVVGQGPAQPPPDDLPERLVYAGLDEWITLSAGEWGHSFGNLRTRTAVIFLSPGLAARTRLVSRYFIDHYLLNFILTEWAMLHASCVLDPGGQRLIALIAPHNTGKSTTALHLLRAGYTFLADGMALLRQDDRNQRFLVGGYPIGEVKLRDDVLALWPDYEGQAVNVREQRKTVVNLRACHPDQLARRLLSPSSIQLCFVERRETAGTQIAPLSPAEARPMLAANTVFWDEAPRLEHNTATLQALLQSARLHRLSIGTGAGGIVAAIDALCRERA
ncbi:MAG: hypothetical protein ACE5H9_16000 [Anaerolineae bacterium]